MVEYASPLDDVFGALADPVRRDILERITGGSMTVNEIAHAYEISLAAVSKHLRVLAAAGLITKRRDGRYYHVSVNLSGIDMAAAYLGQYAATVR